MKRDMGTKIDANKSAPLKYSKIDAPTRYDETASKSGEPFLSRLVSDDVLSAWQNSSSSQINAQCSIVANDKNKVCNFRRSPSAGFLTVPDRISKRYREASDIDTSVTSGSDNRWESVEVRYLPFKDSVSAKWDPNIKTNGDKMALTAQATGGTEKEEAAQSSMCRQTVRVKKVDVTDLLNGNRQVYISPNRSRKSTYKPTACQRAKFVDSIKGNNRDAPSSTLDTYLELSNGSNSEITEAFKSKNPTYETNPARIAARESCAINNRFVDNSLRLQSFQSDRISKENKRMDLDDDCDKLSRQSSWSSQWDSFQQSRTSLRQEKNKMRNRRDRSRGASGGDIRFSLSDIERRDDDTLDHSYTITSSHYDKSNGNDLILSVHSDNDISETGADDNAKKPKLHMSPEILNEYKKTALEILLQRKQQENYKKLIKESQNTEKIAGFVKQTGSNCSKNDRKGTKYPRSSPADTSSKQPDDLLVSKTSIKPNVMYSEVSPNLTNYKEAKQISAGSQSLKRTHQSILAWRRVVSPEVSRKSIRAMKKRSPNMEAHKEVEPPSAPVVSNTVQIDSWLKDSAPNPSSFTMTEEFQPLNKKQDNATTAQVHDLTQESGGELSENARHLKLIQKILKSPTAKTAQALGNFYQGGDEIKKREGKSLMRSDISVEDILKRYHAILKHSNLKPSTNSQMSLDPSVRSLNTEGITSKKRSFHEQFVEKQMRRIDEIDASTTPTSMKECEKLTPTSPMMAWSKNTMPILHNLPSSSHDLDIAHETLTPPSPPINDIGNSTPTSLATNTLYQNAKHLSPAASKEYGTWAPNSLAMNNYMNLMSPSLSVTAYKNMTPFPLAKNEYQNLKSPSSPIEEYRNVMPTSLSTNEYQDIKSSSADVRKYRNVTPASLSTNEYLHLLSPTTNVREHRYVTPISLPANEYQNSTLPSDDIREYKYVTSTSLPANEYQKLKSPSPTKREYSTLSPNLFSSNKYQNLKSPPPTIRQYSEVTSPSVIMNKTYLNLESLSPTLKESRNLMQIPKAAIVCHDLEPSSPTVNNYKNPKPTVTVNNDIEQLKPFYPTIKGVGIATSTSLINNVSVDSKSLSQDIKEYMKLTCPLPETNDYTNQKSPPPEIREYGNCKTSFSETDDYENVRPPSPKIKAKRTLALSPHVAKDYENLKSPSSIFEVCKNVSPTISMTDDGDSINKFRNLTPADPKAHGNDSLKSPSPREYGILTSTSHKTRGDDKVKSPELLTEGCHDIRSNSPVLLKHRNTTSSLRAMKRRCNIIKTPPDKDGHQNASLYSMNECNDAVTISPALNGNEDNVSPTSKIMKKFDNLSPFRLVTKGSQGLTVSKIRRSTIESLSPPSAKEGPILTPSPTLLKEDYSSSSTLRNEVGLPSISPLTIPTREVPSSQEAPTKMKEYKTLIFSKRKKGHANDELSTVKYSEKVYFCSPERPRNSNGSRSGLSIFNDLTQRKNDRNEIKSKDTGEAGKRKKSFSKQYALSKQPSTMNSEKKAGARTQTRPWRASPTRAEWKGRDIFKNIPYPLKFQQTPSNELSWQDKGKESSLQMINQGSKGYPIHADRKQHSKQKTGRVSEKINPIAQAAQDNGSRTDQGTLSREAGGRQRSDVNSTGQTENDDDEKEHTLKSHLSKSLGVFQAFEHHGSGRIDEISSHISNGAIGPKLGTIVSPEKSGNHMQSQSPSERSHVIDSPSKEGSEPEWLQCSKSILSKKALPLETKPSQSHQLKSPAFPQMTRNIEESSKLTETKENDYGESGNDERGIPLMHRSTNEKEVNLRLEKDGPFVIPRSDELDTPHDFTILERSNSKDSILIKAEPLRINDGESLVETEEQLQFNSTGLSENCDKKQYLDDHSLEDIDSKLCRQKNPKIEETKNKFYQSIKDRLIGKQSDETKITSRGSKSGVGSKQAKLSIQKNPLSEKRQAKEGMFKSPTKAKSKELAISNIICDNQPVEAISSTCKRKKNLTQHKRDSIVSGLHTKARLMFKTALNAYFNLKKTSHKADLPGEELIPSQLYRMPKSKSQCTGLARSFSTPEIITKQQINRGYRVIEHHPLVMSRDISNWIPPHQFSRFSLPASNVEKASRQNKLGMSTQSLPAIILQEAGGVTFMTNNEENFISSEDDTLSGVRRKIVRKTCLKIMEESRKPIQNWDDPLFTAECPPAVPFNQRPNKSLIRFPIPLKTKSNSPNYCEQDITPSKSVEQFVEFPESASFQLHDDKDVEVTQNEEEKEITKTPSAGRNTTQGNMEEKRKDDGEELATPCREKIYSKNTPLIISIEIKEPENADKVKICKAMDIIGKKDSFIEKQQLILYPSQASWASGIANDDIIRDTGPTREDLDINLKSKTLKKKKNDFPMRCSVKMNDIVPTQQRSKALERVQQDSSQVSHKELSMKTGKKEEFRMSSPHEHVDKIFGQLLENIHFVVPNYSGLSQVSLDPTFFKTKDEWQNWQCMTSYKVYMCRGDIQRFQIGNDKHLLNIDIKYSRKNRENKRHHLQCIEGHKAMDENLKNKIIEITDEERDNAGKGCLNDIRVVNDVRRNKTHLQTVPKPKILSLSSPDQDTSTRLATMDAFVSSMESIDFTLDSKDSTPQDSSVPTAPEYLPKTETTSSVEDTGELDECVSRNTSSDCASITVQLFEGDDGSGKTIGVYEHSCHDTPTEDPSTFTNTAYDDNDLEIVDKMDETNPKIETREFWNRKLGKLKLLEASKAKQPSQELKAKQLSSQDEQNTPVSKHCEPFKEASLNKLDFVADEYRNYQIYKLLHVKCENEETYGASDVISSHQFSDVSSCHMPQIRNVPIRKKKRHPEPPHATVLRNRSPGERFRNKGQDPLQPDEISDEIDTFPYSYLSTAKKRQGLRSSVKDYTTTESEKMHLDKRPVLQHRPCITSSTCKSGLLTKRHSVDDVLSVSNDPGMEEDEATGFETDTSPSYTYKRIQYKLQKGLGASQFESPLRFQKMFETNRDKRPGGRPLGTTRIDADRDKRSLDNITSGLENHTHLSRDTKTSFASPKDKSPRCDITSGDRKNYAYFKQSKVKRGNDDKQLSPKLFESARIVEHTGSQKIHIPIITSQKEECFPTLDLPESPDESVIIAPPTPMKFRNRKRRQKIQSKCRVTEGDPSDHQGSDLCNQTTSPKAFRFRAKKNDYAAMVPSLTYVCEPSLEKKVKFNKSSPLSCNCLRKSWNKKHDYSCVQCNRINHTELAPSSCTEFERDDHSCNIERSSTIEKGNCIQCVDVFSESSDELFNRESQRSTFYRRESGAKGGYDSYKRNDIYETKLKRRKGHSNKECGLMYCKICRRTICKEKKNNSIENMQRFERNLREFFRYMKRVSFLETVSDSAMMKTMDSYSSLFTPEFLKSSRKLSESQLGSSSCPGDTSLISLHPELDGEGMLQDMVASCLVTALEKVLRRSCTHKRLQRNHSKYLKRKRKSHKVRHDLLTHSSSEVYCRRRGQKGIRLQTSPPHTSVFGCDTNTLAQVSPLPIDKGEEDSFENEKGEEYPEEGCIVVDAFESITVSPTNTAMHVQLKSPPSGGRDTSISRHMSFSEGDLIVHLENRSYLKHRMSYNTESYSLNSLLEKNNFKQHPLRSYNYQSNNVDDVDYEITENDYTHSSPKFQSEPTCIRSLTSLASRNTAYSECARFQYGADDGHFFEASANSSSSLMESEIPVEYSSTTFTSMRKSGMRTKDRNLSRNSLNYSSILHDSERHCKRKFHFNTNAYTFCTPRDITVKNSQSDICISETSHYALIPVTKAMTRSVSCHLSCLPVDTARFGIHAKESELMSNKIYVRAKAECFDEFLLTLAKTPPSHENTFVEGILTPESAPFSSKNVFEQGSLIQSLISDNSDINHVGFGHGNCERSRGACAVATAEDNFREVGMSIISSSNPSMSWSPIDSCDVSSGMREQPMSVNDNELITTHERQREGFKNVIPMIYEYDEPKLCKMDTLPVAQENTVQPITQEGIGWQNPRIGEKLQNGDGFNKHPRAYEIGMQSLTREACALPKNIRNSPVTINDEKNEAWKAEGGTQASRKRNNPSQSRQSFSFEYMKAANAPQHRQQTTTTDSMDKIGSIRLFPNHGESFVKTKSAEGAPTRENLDLDELFAHDLKKHWLTYDISTPSSYDKLCSPVIEADKKREHRDAFRGHYPVKNYVFHGIFRPESIERVDKKTLTTSVSECLQETHSMSSNKPLPCKYEADFKDHRCLHPWLILNKECQSRLENQCDQLISQCSPIPPGTSTVPLMLEGDGSMTGSSSSCHIDMERDYYDPFATLLIPNRKFRLQFSDEAYRTMKHFTMNQVTRANLLYKDIPRDQKRQRQCLYRSRLTVNNRFHPYSMETFERPVASQWSRRKQIRETPDPLSEMLTLLQETQPTRFISEASFFCNSKPAPGDFKCDNRQTNGRSDPWISWDQIDVTSDLNGFGRTSLYQEKLNVQTYPRDINISEMPMRGRGNSWTGTTGCNVPTGSAATTNFNLLDPTRKIKKQENNFISYKKVDSPSSLEKCSSGLTFPFKGNVDNPNIVSKCQKRQTIGVEARHRVVSQGLASHRMPNVHTTWRPNPYLYCGRGDSTETHSGDIKTSLQIHRKENLYKTRKDSCFTTASPALSSKRVVPLCNTMESPRDRNYANEKSTISHPRKPLKLSSSMKRLSCEPAAVQLEKGSPSDIMRDFVSSQKRPVQIPVDVYPFPSASRSRRGDRDIPEGASRKVAISGPLVNLSIPVCHHYYRRQTQESTPPIPGATSMEDKTWKMDAALKGIVDYRNKCVEGRCQAWPENQEWRVTKPKHVNTFKVTVNPDQISSQCKHLTSLPLPSPQMTSVKPTSQKRLQSLSRLKNKISKAFNIRKS